MNAEQLLFEYFDGVVDSREVVSRLRKFILDLAARGRLVIQDENDESASELLELIATKKQQMVECGQIKEIKEQPRVDQSPFRLPDSWSWTRIRQVFSDRGQRVPDSSFTYIDVTAIDNNFGRIFKPRIVSAANAPSRARKIVRKGDVIYSCVRPYLQNIAVVEKEFNPIPIVSTAFAVLNGHDLIVPRYTWVVLRTPFFVELVQEKQRGQAYPAINESDFASLLFPLPPLAEQHRIVAKVDELMEQCNKLEEKFQERDNHRKRFTKASFASLTESGLDSRKFRKRSEFVVGNFDCLSVDVNQITRLRQFILDLAIRGKLVEQNPDDESAEELLIQVARIQSRKQSRELTDLASEYQNFALPAQWIWVPATYPANVVSSHGKQIKTKDILKSGKFPVVDQGKVPIRGFCDDDQKVIRVVDPLILFGDHTREIKFIDFDFVVGADGVKILEPIGIDERFYFFVLQWLPLESKGYSRHFKQLKASYIPFPPLAEQHRIVAKVDELMEQCNHLEERIRLKETLQSRSFCSVLARSLTDQLIG